MLQERSFNGSGNFGQEIAGDGAAREEMALRLTMEAMRQSQRAVVGLLAVPAVRAYTLLNGALALGWGGVVALLVAYVRDDLGRPGGEYGIVLAFAGLGTVLSSLVIAARDERHRGFHLLVPIDYEWRHLRGCNRARR